MTMTIQRLCTNYMEKLYNRFVCHWCAMIIEHSTTVPIHYIVNIIEYCVAWQWLRCEWYCVEMNQIEIRKQFRTFFVLFWVPLIWMENNILTAREPRRANEPKYFHLTVTSWNERTSALCLCNALVPTYCLCVSIYCIWSLAVLCKQFTWVGNTLRYCALTLTRTHNHKHFQKRVAHTILIWI